jgi:hypothetical protein
MRGRIKSIAFIKNSCNCSSICREPIKVKVNFSELGARLIDMKTIGQGQIKRSEADPNQMILDSLEWWANRSHTKIAYSFLKKGEDITSRITCFELMVKSKKIGDRLQKLGTQRKVRLRTSVMATHTQDHLNQALGILGKVKQTYDQL